jgi:hypothetical protein
MSNVEAVPNGSSLLRAVKAPGSAGPSTSFSGNRDNTIKFRHPGYLDEYEQNILMRLYAFDRQGVGLHYSTARVAC